MFDNSRIMSKGRHQNQGSRLNEMEESCGNDGDDSNEIDEYEDVNGSKLIIVQV